jgi:hypothetical protein
MAATPKADALTIEWKRQFRINTQVPGLAFFLVGLLFIAISLQYLKPPEMLPIEFEGTINDVTSPVSIVVRPTNWGLAESNTGEIRGQFYPDLKFLMLVVSAPGYEPLTTSVKIESNGPRIAKIGALKLKPSKVTEGDLEKKIVPLPFESPTLSNEKTSSFGAPL